MMTELSLTFDQCWEAVVRRDRDGRFYFGVLSTGIYCRPSCPARRPLRKNVRFYSTPQAAEAAGLRPCLRCKPRLFDAEAATSARIRELCQYIDEHPEETVQLRDMASRAGLSVFHLQRSFKAHLGISPKEYLEARRVRLLKSNLRHSGSVTDAIYDSGFGSPSRIYERAGTHLGMTPLQYRDGGRGTSISYVAAQTSIGTMMIGATDRGICFLQFGRNGGELEAALRSEYPLAEIAPAAAPDHPQLQLWIESIRSYLVGETGRLDLPLDIRATAFQMRVWKYLQMIPYGSVESYSEVAAAIGQPRAARAVARACASNRVALIIPCHRVIRGTGDPGGYRWGLERKRALIDTERSAAAR